MEAIPLPTPIQLHPVEAASAPVENPAAVRSRRERPIRPVVQPIHGRWYLPCKGVVDFVAALALGVVALPLIAAAALLVKLTSRGPAFYTQTRVGLGGTTIHDLQDPQHDS